MVLLRKIKFSLVFNRLGRLNQEGKGLVQIRAYQSGKSRYFTTNIYIEPQYWDERNKRVKHTHPNQFLYNREIRSMLEEMEAFEIHMINRHGRLSLDRLHEYRAHPDNESPRSFTEFFEQELKQYPIAESSLKSYRITLNKLRAFRSTVYFEDITYGFVVEFDRHLRRLQLSPNSIWREHKVLKTFINLAINRDHLKAEDNPYKKFRPSVKEPTREYLTAEELQKLERLSFNNGEEHLSRLRDIFLVAVYTGLRFSDVTRLTRSNFSKASFGLVLSIKAQKTGKILKLPLRHLFRSGGAERSKVEQLIEKYLAKMEVFDGTRVLDDYPLFPVTNQYMNRALKLIAVKAGIRKKVTFHAARRTFATILATKVKAPVLQRLLQHQGPNMTNIYIQLSNQLIEDELEKIDWQ